MALAKLKQIAEDPILAAAPAAEHGIPKFAHVNELVNYINTLEATVTALTATVAALDARVVILETP